MKIQKPNTDNIENSIRLVSSKSESNRALIIQALCLDAIEIINLSNSDDTKSLKEALKNYNNIKTIDAKHAGTSFRFLTTFLSTQNGTWTLTGSERMQERPIKILVDLLNENDGNISYLDNEGYPPIQITGSELDLSNITIDASVSSQYISALLLVAPTLSKPTNISFKNKITSRPYIDMTLEIMKHFGVKPDKTDGKIFIENKPYKKGEITIESDWSAASYWYEVVALSKNASIELHGLKKESFQGDSAIADIYENFSVTTSYDQYSITLSKNNTPQQNVLELNLNDTPDLAQTIICTCAGLGIEATLTGLESLRIKETDRLNALKKELSKFGITIKISGNDTIHLKGNQSIKTPSKSINTYNDHRMAMAFAPLCLKVDYLEINNPEVVSKSYPNYWEDLEKAGFILE